MSDQFDEREAEVMRFSQQAVRECAYLSLSFSLRPAGGHAWLPGAHEGSDAAPRLEDSHPLQLRIDLGHRIGIDLQVDRQLADRRQLLADSQALRDDCE